MTSNLVSFVYHDKPDLIAAIIEKYCAVTMENIYHSSVQK